MGLLELSHHLNRLHELAQRLPGFHHYRYWQIVKTVELKEECVYAKATAKLAQHEREELECLLQEIRDLLGSL